MANNGIEEIITTLYEMVQDAWSLPLGNEKCVVERDKVLDLLDEISNQLPGELKQAKTIVESRNEVITNAKREAENILKQAEQRAKQIEQNLQNSLEREVSTEAIGEQVMDKLRSVDEVAYVRFASVYRQFKDINTFMSELNKLLNEK